MSQNLSAKTTALPEWIHNLKKGFRSKNTPNFETSAFSQKLSKTAKSGAKFIGRSSFIYDLACSSIAGTLVSLLTTTDSQAVAYLEGCKGCNCTPRFLRKANCTPQFLLISPFFQANTHQIGDLSGPSKIF